VSTPLTLPPQTFNPPQSNFTQHEKDEFLISRLQNQVLTPLCVGSDAKFRPKYSEDPISALKEMVKHTFQSDEQDKALTKAVAGLLAELVAMGYEQRLARVHNVLDHSVNLTDMVNCAKLLAKEIAKGCVTAVGFAFMMIVLFSLPWYLWLILVWLGPFLFRGFKG